MANSDKNYYFQQSALWKRIVGLVEGNPDRVLQWWNTPLPYPPFNLRAPSELVNDAEINILEDWICTNTHGADTEGEWKYKDIRRLDNNATDVDYYNQSHKFDAYNTQIPNYLKYTSEVEAIGGNVSYYHQSNLNNRQWWAGTNSSPIQNTSQNPWKIHTFTSDGDFFVRTGGYIEYLIVGGGGGGGGGNLGGTPIVGSGNGAGGGGGGGGVVTGSMILDAGNYRIKIGSGGSGGYDTITTPPYRQSTNGGDSSAFGIIAYGGGRGGSATATTQNYNEPNATSLTEASSAAAGGYTRSNKATGGGGGLVVTAGADGRNGQGFAGGNCVGSNGGGGGGAGGPGSNATVEVGGTGGVGVLSSITGADVYYGGGGGGGASTLNSSANGVPGGTFGGAGGAGGGASAVQYSVRPSNAGNASANTGGGGAGSTEGYASGNGGSGIVIIRYQDTKQVP